MKIGNRKIYSFMTLALLKAFEEKGLLKINEVLPTADPESHLVDWEYLPAGLDVFGPCMPKAWGKGKPERERPDTDIQAKQVQKPGQETREIIEEKPQEHESESKTVEAFGVKLEEHPKFAEINRALENRTQSFGKLAERFGVSKSVLFRYSVKHHYHTPAQSQMRDRETGKFAGEPRFSMNPLREIQMRLTAGKITTREYHEQIAAAVKQQKVEQEKEEKELHPNKGKTPREIEREALHAIDVRLATGDIQRYEWNKLREAVFRLRDVEDNKQYGKGWGFYC